MNSSGPQEQKTSDESHPTLLLYPPSSPEECGIASALFEGCIPAVRAPSFTLALLTQTSVSHGSYHRCWVKHCSGPREASSALTARCVAQANLEASAREATVPVTAETAARVLIAGYTPPTTATKQTQEPKSENEPSTEKQIKALLHFLITFSF